MKGMSDYGKAGSRVFPIHGVQEIDGEHYCECGTTGCTAKRPYLSWKKGATSDLTRIAEWEIQWPNCNIGLPCGQENGFWVLDVDAKSGGTEKLKALAGKNQFPKTPHAHTGGGGHHYYFLWDDRAEELRISSNSGVFQGVDLKGEGGYIIAPPSKHLSGHSYRWEEGASLCEVDLAPMPDWLYELLKGAMERSGAHGGDQGHTPRFALQKVSSGRWDFLNNMACSLRAKYGYDAKLLFETLRMVQEDRCVWDDGKEPYPEAELWRISKDIEEKIDYVGKPIEDQFTLDDYGNALRFIRQHGSLVRWIPTGQKRSNGLWAVFDGTRWNTAPAVGAHIRTLGTKTIKSIPKEAESISLENEADRRKATLKWGSKCLDNRYLDQMLERVKDDDTLVRDTEDWDRDPFFLNVENGTLVLDAEEIELRDHSPDDYITKVAGTTYDPDATCPRWEQFLEEIFQGDAETIRYMQAVLGYSLTSSVSERLAWFLVGGGANGKSVFLEVVTALMGDYAKKTNNKLLTGDGSTDQLSLLSSLMGARFTYCSELDEGKGLSQAFFKDIVGGEEVETRRFYQDFIKFQPTFKLMLGTNNLPRVPEGSHAIWSRIRVVPFNETFYKQDELDQMADEGKDISGLLLRDDDLKDELIRDELPGILAWCLEGLRRWLKEGLKDCKSVRDATNMYRSDEDRGGPQNSDSLLRWTLPC